MGIFRQRSPLFKAFSKPFSGIYLQWVIVVPFATLIVGAVGVVGYLSDRSGQDSVNKIASRLQNEINTRVAEKTTNYLQIIEQVNKNNISALRRGNWSFDDFSSQERQAWQQLHLNSLSIVGFGAPTGGGRAVEGMKDGSFVIRAVDFGGDRYRSFTTNPDGSPAQVTQAAISFDTRQRPWYQVAIKAKQAAWTHVYPHIYTGELLIALAEPVYNLNNGDLLGVTYGIRTLEEMSRFLRTIDIRTGSVFIMESHGTLVATSLPQETYQLSQNDKEKQLLKAIDSPNLSISMTAKHLRDRFGDLKAIKQSEQFDFVINGDRQLVQAVPIRDRNGLDWVIVVVIPESDFMAEIQANRIWTLLLCGLTLFVAVVISLFTSRWITSPILRLSLASKAIARKNWQEALLEDSVISEVKILSQSFQQMMIELQSADQMSLNYKRDLERQVAEKTKALTEAQRIARVGSWEFDVTTGIITWSSELFHIFGFAPTATLPAYPNIFDRVLPEDRDRLRVALDEAIADGKPYSIEYGNFRLDHSICYLLSNGEAVFDEQGKVIKLRGTAQDISDRKQLEIDLQISESKLNDILNSASAAITRIQFAVDGKWDISYVSKGCETISGYSPAELIADQDLWYNCINPEDLANFQEQIYADIFAQNSGTHVYRFTHKDGSQRWISQTHHSHWDDKQNVYVVTFLSTDISDRKQAELAIKQSEEKYRNLIDNLHCGIVVHAPDTSILLCNDKACQLLGLTIDQMLGKTAIDPAWHFSYEDGIPLPIEAYPVNQVLRTELPLKNYVGRINRNDQKQIWVLVNAFPAFDNNHQIQQVVITFIDISDRKQIEIELEKAKAKAESATKAKSEFLAVMSHEIRTPMNGVLGMAQVLEIADLTEDQKFYVKIIKDSGESLLAILNDILDFSKIEAGMIEMEASEFVLEEVVSLVCQLLSTQINNKQIEIKYTIAPHLPDILIGDRDRLRQILLNLIGNAIKFTERGSIEITVDGGFNPRSNITSDSNYELKFAIADTGIGIAADQISKLFQAFTQADASINRKFGGTGLGLSISKRLIELMDGTIWVESYGGIGGNPPADWQPTTSRSIATKGSTFYFVISVGISLAIGRSDVSLPEAIAIGTHIAAEFPLQILLVEDIPYNQMIAKLMLSKLGYQIDIANNGLEALEMIKNQFYDLILMDVQMPEMDGLTATKLIRTMMENPIHKTQIIAMTADAMTQAQQECIDAGMNGYINKPVNIQEIIQLVTGVKSRRV